MNPLQQFLERVQVFQGDLSRRAFPAQTTSPVQTGDENSLEKGSLASISPTRRPSGILELCLIYYRYIKTDLAQARSSSMNYGTGSQNLIPSVARKKGAYDACL